MSDPLAVTYCTDEALAVRAGGDFLRLVPRDQDRASGTDGYFETATPWVLRSTAVPFATYGVEAGNVVALWGAAPARGSSSAAFTRFGEKDSPTLFAVDSVSGSTLSLRRKGEASGIGQPPGTADGITAVEFRVITLAPQIEDASYEINQRYAIDPALTARTPGDLYDARELRSATVLTVLWKACLAASRQPDDEWAKKALCHKVELDEVLARLSVHWAETTARYQRPTTRFGTRLSR